MQPAVPAALRKYQNPKAKQVCSRSLMHFCYYYLREWFYLKPPPYHKALYELSIIEKDKPRPKRILDIEFRYGGKTRRWSVAQVLWLLCCKPYGRYEDILCLSQGIRLLEECSLLIESQLTSNPLIMADYGSLLDGAKLNRIDEKRLTNGGHWRAATTGAKIRGLHPETLLICDDIEDREESQNPDLREKLADWFYADVLGMEGSDMALQVVGTLVHEQSLLSELWKDQTSATREWLKFNFPAINDDGTAAWPEKFSLERLEQKRSESTLKPNGLALFYQEYLCIPSSMSGGVMKGEWIKYYEKLPMPATELYKSTIVDPAFAERVNKRNDFTAITTLGTVPYGDDKGHVYNLESKRGQWSTSDTVKSAVDAYIKWGSDILIIETVAGAVAYAELLRREGLKRGVYLNLKQVVPKPKENKLNRLESVTPLFQQGLVHFRKEQGWVVDELLLLPNGNHDDGADAMIWGLRDLKDGYIKRLHRPSKAMTIDVKHLNKVAGY